jgi:hypothetical protein
VLQFFGLRDLFRVVTQDSRNCTQAHVAGRPHITKLHTMPDSGNSQENRDTNDDAVVGSDLPAENIVIETGDHHLDHLLTLAAPARPVPFVWQHGNRLLMLSQEGSFWAFADLWFDPEQCTYEERMRAVYEWEREAVGSVLSRALAAGPESVESAAKAMNRWLLVHFGHTIEESRTRPKVRSG